MKTKEEIVEPFIWKDNSGNPRIAIMDCLNAMEIYADQFKQSHIQVVSGMCEHPWASVVGDGEMKAAKCLKCGKYL